MNLHEYIHSPLDIAEQLSVIFKGQKVNTVFDIGSCEGEDAIRYGRFFKGAMVYAFEPRPDNLDIIRKNLRLFKAEDFVKVEGIALSDEKGSFDFYLSSGQPEIATEGWDYGNKSSSLLPPSQSMEEHTAWLKFNEKIIIPTDRMDQFCRERSITNVDFMHIDVQGAELKVLQGAGDLLQKTRAIWMEVEAVELYKGQPLKSDVEQFMKTRNFQCVLDTVNAVAGDQLYVNNALVNPSVIRKLLALQRRRKRDAELRRVYNGIMRRLRMRK
jgi:FkbM family methyltransferase